MTDYKFRCTTTSYADGTCLKGYVRTTYARLISLLGEPQRFGDKITAEWVLKFSDGKIATIYDWKEESTPTGVYDWHIGGHSSAIVERVGHILNAHARGA